MSKYNARLFTALSEPTRLEILELLANSGQMSASDIYKKFSSTPPAISQHLKVLKSAELVSVEKKAQKRLYQINPDKLTELDVWIKEISKQWEERFDRLDEVLKEEKEKLSNRQKGVRLWKKIIKS